MSLGASVAGLKPRQTGCPKILPSYFPEKAASKARQHGPPVNIANLSTGENGDFEAESLASNTDHGGSRWTPAIHFSER
jgi:hypothetical protein